MERQHAQQPGTLLCTVATSLFFPNLNNLVPERQYQKPPRPGDSQAEADLLSLKGKGLLADPAELKRLMAQIENLPML